jgi:hypothetical protein
MKNIFKSFLFLIVAVGLFSCEKDENKVIFEGGTAPVLSASSTQIPLSFVNRNQPAISFNWSNPNYKFTTGLSSQDISYIMEIDSAGSNFTNPNRKSITIANDLSRTFTQSEFNIFLTSQLQLPVDVTKDIDVRIISTLGNNIGALVSNVMRFSVRPFSPPPVVAPPTTNKLFITGSATPASWQCGCGEAELASQRFTRVSNTFYTININLSAGGSYLLLPQYGSWSAKFGGTGGNNNSNNVNGGDFRDGGSDLLAPPVGGLHRIDVDFQRGKFTVTKL